MDPFEGVQTDPLSLHKYLYAHANSVMWRDPSGYYTLTQLSIALTITGTLAGLVTYYITGSITKAVTAAAVVGAVAFASGYLFATAASSAIASSHIFGVSFAARQAMTQMATMIARGQFNQFSVWVINLGRTASGNEILIVIQNTAAYLVTQTHVHPYARNVFQQILTTVSQFRR